MHEKLVNYIDAQMRGLHMLQEAQLPLAFLTILYTTIDVLGHLAAAGDGVRSGASFRGYVEKYMSPHLREVRPWDLWGARCALLHTGSPASDASKKGAARQLLYSWGRADSNVTRQLLKKPQDRKGYAATTFEELREALEKGIAAFLREIEDDPVLHKWVMARVARLFAVIPLAL